MTTLAGIAAVALLCGIHAPSAGQRASDAPSVRSTSFPNEPDGHVAITRRRFRSPREAAGWTEAPAGKLEYVSDASAKGSPPSAARIRFPAGMRGGIAPAHAEYRLPQRDRFRQIYVSYWFKVSRGWYGHPIVSKIGYAWIGGQPMFYVGLVGEGGAPWRAQARLQGLATPPRQGANLPVSPRAGLVARNTWHQLEVVLVANSDGRADGEVRLWLDGTLVSAASDVGWTPAGASAWEAVSWRPIWGGGGGSVPRQQSMYMDDLYISGLHE